MGVDVAIALETKGHLSDYESQILRNGVQEIDLSNNTDLNQMEIGLKQLDKSLQLQQTQFMPTLAAFGQYTYAGQGNKAGNSLFSGEYTPASTAWFGQGLIVGLQLSVPIFHASNFSKVKSIKAQMTETQIQRDYTESLLSTQARVYLDNMNSAAKQVDAAKIAITLAQKAYDISAKRYETGMGTMLELNNATSALSNSRLSYENAIDDYLTVKADYEKIIGQQ
jgi:outer membrane protein TolC